MSTGMGRAIAVLADEGGREMGPPKRLYTAPSV